jgi:hypothetical protein
MSDDFGPQNKGDQRATTDMLDLLHVLRRKTFLRPVVTTAEVAPRFKRKVDRKNLKPAQLSRKVCMLTCNHPPGYNIVGVCLLFTKPARNSERKGSMFVAHKSYSFHT